MELAIAADGIKWYAFVSFADTWSIVGEMRAVGIDGTTAALGSSRRTCIAGPRAPVKLVVGGGTR